MGARALLTKIQRGVYHTRRRASKAWRRYHRAEQREYAKAHRDAVASFSRVGASAHVAAEALAALVAAHAA